MSYYEKPTKNERKFRRFTMLNFLYLVSLILLIPAIREFEFDVFLIVFFIFIILGTLLFVIHMKWDLENVVNYQQFFNEKILGLHFQILIYEKHQFDIQKEIESFKFVIDKKEKEVLKNNLISLETFELIQNYKYIMIAMGSILEFLLIKYCTTYDVNPVDYKTPDGNLIKANRNRLVNYIQSAIDNNLFEQKKKWKFVQAYLRDFRNYVHITKESIDEEIDKDWYKSMKPIFYSIFKSFKS